MPKLRARDLDQLFPRVRALLVPEDEPGTDTMWTTWDGYATSHAIAMAEGRLFVAWQSGRRSRNVTRTGRLLHVTPKVLTLAPVRPDLDDPAPVRRRILRRAIVGQPLVWEMPVALWASTIRFYQARLLPVPEVGIVGSVDQDPRERSLYMVGDAPRRVLYSAYAPGMDSSVVRLLRAPSAETVLAYVRGECAPLIAQLRRHFARWQRQQAQHPTTEGR